VHHLKKPLSCSSSFRFLVAALAATTLAARAAVAAPEPMRAGGAAPAAPAAAAAPSSGGGTVVETMSVATYTYARVKTATGETWVAGPQTTLKVGDAVSWPSGTEMKDFASKSLNRTFDSILFVDRLDVGGAAPAAGASPHAPVGQAHGALSGKAAEATEVTGIKKADGGLTVAEVYDRRAELTGKEVSVRGKVVKFNAGVMGRNWIHLRDGSHGKDGENDLTATGDSTVAVGDVVVVKGKVARDQDFGFGYHYEVMLEGASVTGK
jgi:hypothetical protein